MPVFNENGKIDDTKCMSMSDGKKSDRSIVSLRHWSLTKRHHYRRSVISFNCLCVSAELRIFSYLKVRHNTNVQSVSAKLMRWCVFWLSEKHVISFCLFVCFGVFRPTRESWRKLTYHVLAMSQFNNAMLMWCYVSLTSEKYGFYIKIFIFIL